MKILEINIAEKEARERLDKTRSELSSAIQELDTVKSQIADQRRGFTNVYRETLTYDQWKLLLEEQVKLLETLRLKTRDNFVSDAYKEFEKIESLQKQANVIISDIERLEEIKLDVEKKKQEYTDIKERIQIAGKELSKLQSERTMIDKELNEREQDIIESESKLAEEREYLSAMRSSLEKKDKELNLKEKRLEKLKIDIKK